MRVERVRGEIFVSHPLLLTAFPDVHDDGEQRHGHEGCQPGGERRRRQPRPVLPRGVVRILERPEHAGTSVGVSLFEIEIDCWKLLDPLNRRSPVKCLEDSRGKVHFPRD